MKEKNEAFPNGLEAAFLVIFLFVAEYLIYAVLIDLKAFSDVNPRDMGGVVAVLGNGILFTALLHYKGLSYKSLFHSSEYSVAATVGTLSFPILCLIPALTLGMWVTTSALMWLFPMSHWQEMMFESMTSNGVVSIITVCILAPILEEMLFRGILLRSFLCQYSRTASIFGSAALFGIAHLNIYQFAVGFVIGLVQAGIVMAFA